MRILYQKLGLKFHDEKFPESKIKEKDEKIDMSKKGNKKKNGKKEQLPTISAGKSSPKKEISDSASESSKTDSMESTLAADEQGESLMKSTKKRVKKNKKSKMSKTATDEEEKQKMENVHKIPSEIRLEGEGSPKEEVKGTSSPKGKSHKIIEESEIDKNKRKEKEDKEKREKNLEIFNNEFGKPIQIGTSLRRAESAPKRSQIQNGIEEITEFIGNNRRSQSANKQIIGQKKIVKLNILKDYKFAGKNRNINKIKIIIRFDGIGHT